MGVQFSKSGAASRISILLAAVWYFKYNAPVASFLTLKLGKYLSVKNSEPPSAVRSEEHTSELQSQSNLVCRLLLEKKKRTIVEEVSHFIQLPTVTPRISTPRGLATRPSTSLLHLPPPILPKCPYAQIHQHDSA